MKAKSYLFNAICSPINYIISKLNYIVSLSEELAASPWAAKNVLPPKIAYKASLSFRSMKGSLLVFEEVFCP